MSNFGEVLGMCVGVKQGKEIRLLLLFFSNKHQRNEPFIPRLYVTHCMASVRCPTGFFRGQQSSAASKGTVCVGMGLFGFLADFCRVMVNLMLVYVVLNDLMRSLMQFAPSFHLQISSSTWVLEGNLVLPQQHLLVYPLLSPGLCHGILWCVKLQEQAF